MKSFHVGIKAIIADPDRGILLLRRDYQTGETWDVPGGRIDGDEDFDQTLSREITEELPGCSLKSMGKLLGGRRIHKDIMPDTSLVLMFFEAEVDLPKVIELSDEHDGYMFVKTAADIPTGVGAELIVVLEQQLSQH
jgi:ADP-ribose pyrophosphatase YjhB (NUDIX family)